MNTINRPTTKASAMLISISGTENEATLIRRSDENKSLKVNAIYLTRKFSLLHTWKTQSLFCSEAVPLP